MDTDNSGNGAQLCSTRIVTIASNKYSSLHLRLTYDRKEKKINFYDVQFRNCPRTAVTVSQARIVATNMPLKGYLLEDQILIRMRSFNKISAL